MDIISKKSKILFYTLTAILLLVFCLSYILFIALPDLMEKELSKFIIKRAGISEFSAEIHRIGLTGSDTGEITVGGKAVPLLKIDTIHLDYGLRDLFNRKINTIIINGLVINVRFEDGKILFPDSDREVTDLYEQINPTPDIDISNGNNEFNIPFQRLNIKNGTFIIKKDKQVFKVPFDSMILPNENHYGIINSIINMSPFQSDIALTADVDLNKKQLRIELNGEKVDLTHITNVLKIPENSNLTGLASINSKLNMSLNPPAINQFETTCTISRFGFLSDRISVKTSDQAFNIYLTKKPDNTWHINSTPFDLVNPLSATVSGLNFGLFSEENSLVVKGNTILTVNPQIIRYKKSNQDAITQAFSTNVHFYSRLDNKLEWTAELSNRIKNPEKAETLIVNGNDFQVSVNNPQISISAAGNMKKGSIDTTLRLPGLNLSVQDKHVETSQMDFSTESLYMYESGIFTLNSKFNLISKNNQFQFDDLIFKSPRILFSGEAGLKDSKLNNTQFQTTLVNGSVHHKKSGLSITGISLKQPWSLSPLKKQEAGRYAIKEVTLKKIHVGSTEGSIYQTNDSFIFSGNYNSGFFDPLKATYSGEINTGVKSPQVKLKYQIPEFEIKEEINIKDYVKHIPDIKFKGFLYGSGNYQADRYTSGGTFKAGYKKGVIVIPDSNITLTDVSTEITFPDLPAISTLPDQVVNIPMADIGDIHLKNGKIHCRIESESSLFLEKSSFEWCSGSVDLQSLRISPQKSEYYITLYCNQLNLDQLLKQLGDIKSEGGGTLNGKIPVLIKKKNIRFDDGFLYSTPGRGGNIKLLSTDVLTSGVAAGTAEFAQIDLAAEALKDYDYNWTKLALSSDEETLHVKLQFDGKPSNPLPFTYNAGDGGFIRSKNSEMDFKGLSLDINLNFPINKILAYDKLTELLSN